MTSAQAGDIQAWLHVHFAIPEPTRVEPIAAGTNNRSFLVTTDRASYVLKQYRNVGIEQRLPFEHALLTALSQAGLPFAVPVPVSTRSGGTSPTIHRDGEPWRIALFPRIPGRTAAFGNVVEAEQCGTALAILDQALATVRLDPSVMIPDTFGPLRAVHELVPEPHAAIKRLFGSSARTSTMQGIMERAEENWALHTKGWPPQQIHSDYYPSNMLIDTGTVSGVLDFEYSGTGYRAMDFAIGLVAFSTKDWRAGPVWSALGAFAEGYLSRVSLTTEELSAIPNLWVMREATSFIHFLGRMEQGLTSREEIEDRAHRLLAVHQWVLDFRDQLVDRLNRSARHR